MTASMMAAKVPLSAGKWTGKQTTNPKSKVQSRNSVLVAHGQVR